MSRMAVRKASVKPMDDGRASPSADVRRRSVKIVVTLALCGTLYAAADWRAVANQLAALDGRLLLAALALFVPQTIVSAWRWSRLAAPWSRLTLAESTAHTPHRLAWNLIVPPAEAGDFSKVLLAPSVDAEGRKRLTGCAVEKVADLAARDRNVHRLATRQAATAMLVVLSAAACSAATIAYPRFSVDLTTRAIGTAVLWTLHLTQIHFSWAAGVRRVAQDVVGLRAGRTLGGKCRSGGVLWIGTRDAAPVRVSSPTWRPRRRWRPSAYSPLCDVTSAVDSAALVAGNPLAIIRRRKFESINLPIVTACPAAAGRATL